MLMMLVRLSGHSGAGKSRLTAALPHCGINCQRAILYTSRPARDEEAHGQEYYFLSRGAIAALPGLDFHIGPALEMLQAVDLSQLELDLRASNVVLIEIFADLWPGLLMRLEDRMRQEIPNASVFMTAVDPKEISARTESERDSFIETEVRDILTNRGKDKPDKVEKRAKSAVKEVLTAIGPEGSELYTRVLHSSPEGIDGKDDWTREPEPAGRAKHVLQEFVDFMKSFSE